MVSPRHIAALGGGCLLLAVALPNNAQIELPATAADVYVGQAAQGVPVAS